MEKRILGRTGIEVSEIGHGTWTMGSMWGPLDDREAIASLKRSLELGVSFIDTAFVYGDGHSEQLIGRVLRETGSKAFVATKVPPKNYQWPARHHVPVTQTFPADHIVKFTETSLKNLKMNCVDLQQLHVWSDNWLTDSSWIEGVERLKSQGKIRFFGISINDHEPDSALKMVESGLIDSVQVIYNIFDQTPEEKLFPLCQKKNVAVIARVPFDEGSLTGKFTPGHKFPKGDWRVKYFTPERLNETCARVERVKHVILRQQPKDLTSPSGGFFADAQNDMTLPQAALKFCLAHPAVSTVIPGMRTVAHVEDNCAASDGKLLARDELAELKKHAWPRNFYPVYG